MKDNAPILDGHAPFFFNIHNSQINSFLHSIIIGKLHFYFGVFSYPAVEILYGVGGVYYLSDLQWIIKYWVGFTQLFCQDCMAYLYFVPHFKSIANRAFSAISMLAAA